MAWRRSVSANPWVPKPIAVHTAEIGPDLLDSSFRFATGITEEVRDRALVRAPDWSLEAWRALSPVDASTRAYLALAKLKALLDFGSEIPNGSSGEISAWLGDRFPDARARRAGALYRCIVVKSVVRTTGTADWECVVPGTGHLPDGIVNDSMDPGTDLKLYVQNLARLDVTRRLEALDAM